MIHPKVKAGSAAAVASGVIIWLLSQYVFHGTVDPAVQAVVYAAVPGLLTLAAGYLTPSPKGAQHAAQHAAPHDPMGRP